MATTTPWSSGCTHAVGEPSPSAGQRWFRVDVQGLEHFEGPQRQIIFHGVNKSGSLTMVNVLHKSYRRANRANQFFSTYKNIPRGQERLVQLIGHSTGHAYFAGHYLYGAYPHRDEQLLVTQFRNPLPRVRSCYQWMKDHHDVGGRSFTDWVVHSRGISHSQIMQFSIGFGPEADRLRRAPGDELFELAIRNIERDVAWFGIAEYFEESVYAMAALCGLPRVPLWKQDVRNEDRALVPTWTQTEIDIVRETFRWDFALYDWALERFKQNLAPLRFNQGLDRYKAACSGQYKDRLDAQGKPLGGEEHERIVVTVRPRSDGPRPTRPPQPRNRARKLARRAWRRGQRALQRLFRGS
jgi:hypothetical protein